MMRFVAFIVGLLVACFGWMHSSVVLAAPPAPQVYTYAGQYHPSVVVTEPAERGPQAVPHDYTAYNAVDRWSRGAWARPGGATPAAIFAYDRPALLVQVARSSGTTDDQPRVLDMDYSPFQRSQVAAKPETELVQRWISQAELDATRSTGLVRGGRGGTYYVTDFADHDQLRARKRLALPQTPEVRTQLEVPRGAFSPPKTVRPDFNMPGGGLERTATGPVQRRVVCVWD